MPHSQSYGQDKFAFCWVRILAGFELQTLISSNPGPGWSWNSLGCNFNSWWTENIERLGWFKSFEASKHQLEQQSTFTDLTSTSSAAFITENASEKPVRAEISINRVQFIKLQDKRERPSEFQLDCGPRSVQSRRFTSQRDDQNTTKSSVLLNSETVPKPNSANTALRELKSRSVINIAMINDNPSPELDWCPTAKVMAQFGLHFCLSEPSECMRAPKPNSANKALWELKSRSVINIAMISDNPSPELDWCPTAKVMVQSSLHFWLVRIFASSNFKH